MRKTRALGLIVIAAAMALTTACGSDDSGSGNGNGAGKATTAPAEKAALIKTATSPLGTIIVDSQGNTLYMFTKDEKGSGKSTCYNDCAKKWPVLVAQAEVPVGANLTGQVGSIVRTDGTRQATLNGWPLYRYAADSGPGSTNGHKQGGVWFVLTPAGVPVK